MESSSRVRSFEHGAPGLLGVPTEEMRDALRKIDQDARGTRSAVYARISKAISEGLLMFHGNDLIQNLRGSDSAPEEFVTTDAPTMRDPKALTFDILHLVAGFLHDQRDLETLADVAGINILKHTPPKPWHLMYGAKSGNIKFFEYATSRQIENFGRNSLAWNPLVKAAAREGHFEIVDFLISKGADPVTALYAASRGGHLALVDALFSEIADEEESNYSHETVTENFLTEALKEAARGGSRDVVDLLLSRAQDYFYDFLRRDSPIWNTLMGAAAWGGHRELVELFISEGADDWSRGMVEAAGGLYSPGSKEYDEGYYSRQGSLLDLVKFFISRSRESSIESSSLWGRQHPQSDYNRAIGAAGTAGNYEMVDFLISKGANWQLALRAAKKQMNHDMIGMLEARFRK